MIERCLLLNAPRLLVCLGLLAAGCATPGTAVGSAGLVVRGPGIASVVLVAAQLETLGSEEILLGEGERAARYRGVRLDLLLRSLGLVGGPDGTQASPAEKRPGWRRVVITTATDGFYAVFSTGELLPELGSTRAYICWEREGAPLPPSEGPWRMLVPTDRRGSRAARKLTAIDVRDVRPDE